MKLYIVKNADDVSVVAIDFNREQAYISAAFLLEDLEMDTRCVSIEELTRVPDDTKPFVEIVDSKKWTL